GRTSGVVQVRKLRGRVRACAGTRQCSFRRVRSLREDQLEAALELRIAGRLQRGDRAGLVVVQLTTQRAAATGLAGFAQQLPAAQQVGLELELDEARGFVAVGAL